MRYLGLDIATATGWAFFEDDELLERGTIQLIPGMELPQKLHYFHLELNNLLTRLQPEYCFIEDVILGISGAKTLAFLARLNGVAINTAFSILQEKVRLYTPTFWKSNSYDSLGGMAKKWQIQLAVIDHYCINITGTFDHIQSIIDENEKIIDQFKTDISNIREDINSNKSKLKRKRNPLTKDENNAVAIEIAKLETEYKQQKAAMKKTQQSFDKRMVAISNDIVAQTGFTDNIADACGVAYCGWKEIIQNDN